MKLINSLSTLLLCALCALSAAAQWMMQEIKTTAGLRGLSVVNANVVWASGTTGTVLRTLNGGATWDVIQVPDADKLDFRDIEAFDDKTAYLLSIGTGAASRIYKTTDGGKTWWLSYQNTNEKAFFDAIAFWDKDHGLAMSDPVNGRFLILTTDDGGKSWRSIEKNAMPEALPGEGGFAASGTCLITQGKRNAYLVSGGNTARVFRSTDRGRTWQVSATPLRQDGTAAGAFSIAFKDDKNGLLVGGDYQKPDDGTNAAAFTQDGGATWKLLNEQPYGFRSCVVWADGVWVAAGTSGSDYLLAPHSPWIGLGRGKFNAVQFAQGIGWAVGPEGRVGKFTGKLK
jgi:photosystem II stability/assembly factor-like uncharacterized protein